MINPDNVLKLTAELAKPILDTGIARVRMRTSADDDGWDLRIDLDWHAILSIGANANPDDIYEEIKGLVKSVRDKLAKAAAK